ncbi:OTU domain-containing protein [Lachnellula suecica]|uniref:OTU domain-containing protein n=1 Tax=Lachnellula suecica TaxID=602035 RepID=A0A8T9BVZ4_9HELO|nr:OTU domain-containing protein [Lachnellula suecica]
MAPKASAADADEFPVLKLHNLKATAILGDGNCLFNALSDQIYGDQNSHREIRARVVQEMREHPEDYKSFFSVQGYRDIPNRKAKRKNVAAAAVVTDTQINKAFEDHCSRMAKNGVYGDNHEIRAFTRAYNTDAIVFSHRGVNYTISAGPTEVARPRAYIALHSYEHYSSIRNIDGPFTSLPQIPRINLEGEDDVLLPENIVIKDWQIQVVMSAIPNLANEEVIRTALVQNYGNVDNAVSYLMDSQFSSSPSTPASFSASQSGNSSVERDYDSDEDEIYGPNKRQNRKGRGESATRLTEKKEKEAIPTIELTGPDAEVSNDALIEIHQPAPLKPSVHKLMDYDEAGNASDGDDEFRPEDSTSENDVSSRSPSVDPANPPPHPRVILRTKGNKTAEATLDPQNSQSSQNTQTSDSQRTQGSKPKHKTHITARQRKVDKKAAQKKASTERKRQGSQAQEDKLKPSTSNIARNPPSMEKVVPQMGKLNMFIKA